MQPIIEVRSLKKNYGNHILFDNVNIQINSKEMIAIMGKSGTGKTTLLNILGLIEPASAGEIFYYGDKVNFRKQSMISKLLKTKIGFLFQNFALLNEKSIYENLKVALPKNSTNKKRKMKLALSKVDLIKPLDDKIFYLSGGEQQRVAIARLFLKENDIIFADEPTGSLDEENRDSVLSLLQGLKNEGKTIVIVTHDKIVGEYCDRIINLQNDN